MAAAGAQQPSFRIELLPDAARDALFRALLRDEVARACCVCRAWNRSLSLRARHLWSDICFDAAHFGIDVTDAVVRGAAAKGGDALRSLSALPRAALHVLPSLSARHPALGCVRLVDAHSTATADELGALLSACDVVQELHASICVSTYDMPDDNDNNLLPVLLQHPSLRMRSLRVDVFGIAPNAEGVFLPCVAAALQTHAPWLVELRIVLFDNDAQFDIGPAVEAFAAALSACATLKELALHDVFTRAAFDVVARALANHRALALHFIDLDFADHAESSVAHLMPAAVSSLRLVDVRFGGPSLAVMNEAVRTSANLEELELSLFYDDPAPHVADVVSFCGMLHATSVTRLTLGYLTNAGSEALLAGGLPPRLQSLRIDNMLFCPEVTDRSLDVLGSWRRLLAMLPPTMTELVIDVQALDRFYRTPKNLCDDSKGVCELARFIRDDVRLLHFGFRQAGEPLPALAAALWANRTLRKLSVYVRTALACCAPARSRFSATLACAGSRSRGSRHEEATPRRSYKILQLRWHATTRCAVSASALRSGGVRISSPRARWLQLHARRCMAWHTRAATRSFSLK